MRLQLWQKLALLFFSVVVDIVQGAFVAMLAFEAVMCAVPSITGVGAIVTFFCEIVVGGQLPFILLANLIFALIWAAAVFAITKRKIAVAVGVFEAIPILDALPLYTATAVYVLIKE